MTSESLRKLVLNATKSKAKSQQGWSVGLQGMYARSKPELDRGIQREPSLGNQRESQHV
jgi:hypothetical protein